MKIDPLDIFFRIMDDRIEKEPDENDCLAIINNLSLVIDSLSRYEQKEAYAILGWLDSTSPKLKICSPDFEKMFPESKTKLFRIIAGDDNLSEASALPEASTLKKTLSKILRDEGLLRQLNGVKAQ